MEIAHVALALVVALWLAMSLCKIDVWCGGCGGGSAGGPNGDGCKRLSLQWERVVCHLQCGGGGSGAVVVVVVGVFHKTTGAIIAMDMATGAMANGRLCRPRFCIGRGAVVFNVLVTCSVALVLATAEVVQVAVGGNQCCCSRYGCMPDEMKTSGMRCKHPRQRMLQEWLPGGWCAAAAGPERFGGPGGQGCPPNLPQHTALQPSTLATLACRVSNASVASPALDC